MIFKSFLIYSNFILIYIYFVIFYDYTCVVIFVVNGFLAKIGPAISTST